MTHNRYFLETDPKIVGEDRIGFSKQTKEYGMFTVTVKRGILNGPYSEEEKFDYVLKLINKMEDGIEKAIKEQQ